MKSCRSRRFSPSTQTTTGTAARTAIVGAGVSGLGIGWRLARAGHAVDVFDLGLAGSGASNAAAGMLAAGVECEPGEELLLDFTRASQTMWPEFAREVEAASGVDVGYRDEGTLVVALTRDDADRLRFSYEFQTGLGIDLHWLSGAEALEREPRLRPGIAAAVYSPRDHQVDNRRLVTALKAAFLAAGGRLHEQCRVARIDLEAGRVAGLVLDDGGDNDGNERRHAAETVILAAGAWSADVPGLPGDARPPVRPVKGQMLALDMDPAAPLLRHVLWTPSAYLVPRRDGRLLVGATVEEKGFDGRMTAGGVFALLEAAWRAVPAIEELPIAEMWAGFRPTSRDDAPILGPTPVEGLVLATGHHRNGILLAPITAEAVSRFVLEGELMEEARPFTLARFAAGEAARHGAVTVGG